MITTNGGGSNQSTSIAAVSSTESLLAISFEYSKGDEYHKTEISLGNDINLGLLFNASGSKARSVV